MFKLLVTNIVAKRLRRKLADNTVSRADIDPVLAEVRVALIDADVNAGVVDDLLEAIAKRVVGVHLDKGMSPQNFVVTAIKDELTAVLGARTKSFDDRTADLRVMLVGLQGSGKTTTAAKVARHFKERRGRNPLLVAADTQRPAAVEQLRTLGEQVGVEVFHEAGKSPAEQVELAKPAARQAGKNMTIVDTAGRTDLNDELLGELSLLRRNGAFDEVFLVVDALVGQSVVDVAKRFDAAAKLTGVIVTKFDSDARGGAALSLAHVLKVPIVFVGTGERVGSLEVFHPNRMAERILGMGDVLSLAERAAEAVDENRARGQMERIFAGKMDLEDLLSQISSVAKMGSLSSVAKLIPGADRIGADELERAEAKMLRWQTLMSSMTLKERRGPKVLEREASRRNRIVKGAGMKPDDLNKLLAEWKKARDRMEKMGRDIRMGKNPFGSLGG